MRQRIVPLNRTDFVTSGRDIILPQLADMNLVGLAQILLAPYSSSSLHYV